MSEIEGLRDRIEAAIAGTKPGGLWRKVSHTDLTAVLALLPTADLSQSEPSNRPEFPDSSTPETVSAVLVGGGLDQGASTETERGDGTLPVPSPTPRFAGKEV